MTKRARVVSVGRNVAWVVIDDEAAPRVAQLRRFSGRREMLAPGDVVDVRPLDDGTTIVDHAHPRATTLHRRTPHGRSKTMAANVDALVAVTAFSDPAPRTLTLDQLLGFAELEGIDALLVFTKPDLVADTQRRILPELYQRIGYATLCINPKTGEGIAQLRLRLAGRHALLCGNSGVGKSTIFRALGGTAAIGEVSRHGLGRQTTSSGRLVRQGDGFLIDSPGVAEFGLGSPSDRELASAFREIPGFARDCRFRDCRHLREPGCAVAAAVATGAIAASRFASYRRILERSPTFSGPGCGAVI